MADTLSILNSARLAFYDGKPVAFLKQTVAQSIANSTPTAVTFGAVVGDSWSAWSAGSPSLYTVQVAGLYSISGLVIYTANSTNARDGYIYYNGTAIAASQVEYPGASASVGTVPIPTILQPASAGDTFQLFTSQNSGGALSTLVGASTASSMTVMWVRT